MLAAAAVACIQQALLAQVVLEAVGLAVHLTQMEGWEPAGAGGATFKVYVNPLVNWLWAGGLVFIIGTLVATWPERRELQTAAERARVVHLPVRSVTGGV